MKRKHLYSIAENSLVTVFKWSKNNTSLQVKSFVLNERLEFQKENFIKITEDNKYLFSTFNEKKEKIDFYVSSEHVTAHIINSEL